MPLLEIRDLEARVGDKPILKGLSLTVDRGDIAISNGKVVSDTAGPAITQHTMVFAPTPKMSSYLVAIVVVLSAVLMTAESVLGMNDSDQQQENSGGGICSVGG